MPQQTSSQELTSSFTTGFATGTVCTRTGSYKASNNYMQAIVVVVKGNKFPNFTDGKKTTWYALSSSGASASDDGFTAVTAQAGAA